MLQVPCIWCVFCHNGQHVPMNLEEALDILCTSSLLCCIFLQLGAALSQAVAKQCPHAEWTVDTLMIPWVGIFFWVPRQGGPLHAKVFELMLPIRFVHTHMCLITCLLHVTFLPILVWSFVNKLVFKFVMWYVPRCIHLCGNNTQSASSVPPVTTTSFFVLLRFAQLRNSTLSILPI